MYAFDNNGYSVVGEYGNAYGWCAYVWNALFEKYVPKEHPYDCWLNKADRVWSLAKGDRLSDCEKYTLMSTFDNALVLKKDIPKLIRYFREFEKLYHDPNVVCHLVKMAWELERISRVKNGVVAIGWNGMSVGDNPWNIYNEKTDDYDAYSIQDGTKHWFLEFLESDSAL
jgi:hypothetical protein